MSVQPDQTRTGTADALSLSHVDISYRERREEQRVVRDASVPALRERRRGFVTDSRKRPTTGAKAVERAESRPPIQGVRR